MGLPTVDSQCHDHQALVWPMEDGWMGGRVVEGGSLENCCTREGTLGSNPSPSALSLNSGETLGRRTSLKRRQRPQRASGP